MIYIGIIVSLLLASSAATIIIIKRKQTVLLAKFHTLEASLKSSTSSIQALTKELKALQQAQRAQHLTSTDTGSENRHSIINKDTIKSLVIDLEKEGLLSQDKRRSPREIIIIQEYIHHCGTEELSLEEEMEVILDEARELIQITGVASANLLKDKLRISQNTAQTILDKLEEEGIVGPSDGTSHRNVFKRE